MTTQIIIPSSGVIELYDDVPLSLNYNVANIRSPEKRNADFSKVILAPGTRNNNRLLAHVFDINADRYFNPNKKTIAEIVVDNVPVMKGILRLARINTLQDNKIEYELELKGRLDDLFTAIKDKLLTDINWSNLDHTWNKDNIRNSWTATVGTGYVYPWIDYGLGLPPGVMEVKSFLPATYVKEIWDRIFSFAGFEYLSTFLNTDYFKRLIIPFTSEKFSFLKSDILQSIFRSSRSSNQAFTYVNAGFPPLMDTIAFDDESTPPNSDAGNVYTTATGKFTASRAGIYSFTSQVIFHFAIDISASIQAFVRLMKNTSTELPYSEAINFFYDPAVYSFDTGVDFTKAVAWTGFLNAGETVEATIYTLISAVPSSQNNYVAKNSFFYNALNPELVANASIPYSSAIPQNVKMEDFLLAIIKMFNLYFEYDKDTHHKIFIEPRNDYYNTRVQDWSKKLDTGQALVIEPMGTLDTKRYIFKYRQDADWLNERYQASFQQVKEESYGAKIKTVDNDFLKNDNVLEIMFSPTPLYSDAWSERVFPKIINAHQDTQTPNIVNANLRILYYGGQIGGQPWTFYEVGLNNGTPQTKYPYCGHLDSPTSPTHDLCFGVPKEVYYIPQWAATYTNNNLYNRFWRQFIEEITDKDSSIVTGWFRLTPADIAMLDFRNFYRFGFQNYRLNKICDYDPVKEGLTKCEFFLTKITRPFVASSLLLTGARDATFDGVEASPSLPPAVAAGGNNPRKETTEKTVVGNNNYVSESATGVVITGDQNIVGDMAQNVAILQSSGVIVAGGLKNVTVLHSSGITVLESNAIYQFNTKVKRESAVKVYSGWLTQIATDAPTIVIQENTLSGTPEWFYDSTGLYHMTLANEFPGNSTSVTIETAININNEVHTSYEVPDVIFVQTTSVGAPADDVLSATFIKVEVYTNQ